MEIFQGEGARLLVQAILSLETEDECRHFLEDLMTGKEIQDCSQRIMVAELLREKQIYSAIAAATGASTATISRVNRCYAYGAGGYQTVLERIEPERRRLVLRPAAADDWKTVQQLFFDFGKSPYYMYDPIENTDDASVKNWVQGMIQNHVIYAVSLQDNPAMIGYVCFHIDGEAYDIGYLFFSAHQGLGYATEAAQAAMNALIKERNIRLFTATAAAPNLPSVRVLEKLGFTITSSREVPFHPSAGMEGTYEELQYQYSAKQYS